MKFSRMETEIDAKNEIIAQRNISNYCSQIGVEGKRESHRTAGAVTLIL